MSANSTPTFFQVLDLVIQAFHLDQEEPELCGSSRWQHLFTGGRIDIKDKNLRELLRRFSSALRRAKVFPVLLQSLAWDRPGARVPAVAKYLIDAGSLPCAVDDPDEAMADRLLWLADQHEEMLSKARSHVASDEIESAFGLMPLMRFTWHHLTVVFALLEWVGVLNKASLRPNAPPMTWLMEEPSSTPMKEASKAAKISLRKLEIDLAGSDSGLHREWNEKTLANLHAGGPSHPTLGSIRAVVDQIDGGDANALPRWRRWYGLRHLARQCAALWGWEWLSKSFATSVAHAARLLHDLRLATAYPATTLEQRRTIASVGLVAGWRLGFTRFVFGQAAQAPGNEPEPLLRLDYHAIGTETERMRLQTCLGIAAFGSSLEASLRKCNRDAATARAEALRWIRDFQGGQSPAEHLHPGLELLRAKVAQDWPAMERAARTLVEQRPDVLLNHGFLVDALAKQEKFDEALAATRRALDTLPADPDLQRVEVHVLMHRGDVNADPRDFELAREKLLAMESSESDWRVHLLLADCHLALGAWAEARDECKLVSEHNYQCGEARAIASICSAKLGDRQAENKAAEHAGRRGEKELLAILHDRDARGELAPSSPNHAPRWHRLYMSQLLGWLIIDPSS